MLIVEDVADTVGDQDLIDRVIGIYNAKYRWNADSHNMPGPLHRVRPRVVFGWHADDTGLDGGSAFHGHRHPVEIPGRGELTGVPRRLTCSLRARRRAGLYASSGPGTWPCP